jgi:tetratricopeptide (TPR) repeat protein
MFAGALLAETINLKNGRTILADSVREVNGRVEYTVGENTYALPKSSVERIDTGGTPVVTNSEVQDKLPVPAVNEDITASGDQSAASKVIHDGKVDTDALAVLESAGDKEISAIAYFLAAKYEMAHGSMEKAALYLEHARLLLPGNDVLLVHQASVSAQMGKMADAAAFAERAVKLAPLNAGAFAMLGYADMQMDKLKEAVKALKRSTELQPDPAVEEMLARAQREVQAESTFAEEATSHFKLRFEGGQAAPELRRQILEILETDFNDLVRSLNFSPRESIFVILYTDKQFFDVTQAPSWSGALFDGKLRLPINGVKVVDTEFARVLKHELTHSLIAQLRRGRFPTWLHESHHLAVYARHWSHLFARRCGSDPGAAHGFRLGP